MIKLIGVKDKEGERGGWKSGCAEKETQIGKMQVEGN